MHSCRVCGFAIGSPFVDPALVVRPDEPTCAAPLPPLATTLGPRFTADDDCAESSRARFECGQWDIPERAKERAELAAAYYRGGPRAVLHEVGTRTIFARSSRWSHVWTCAMGALYGPNGVHPSRLADDGTPREGECPSIDAHLEDCRDGLARVLRTVRR